LRGIHVTADDGEIVAILGSSGCGKTTLLRLVAGLDEPSNGEIRLDNQIISGTHPAVSAVFQEPRLLPWLNVAGNIAFGGQRLTSAERDRRTEALLSRIGLASYGKRWPRDLSGGQQQRVAIARALIGHPGILYQSALTLTLLAITKSRVINSVDMWRRVNVTTGWYYCWTSRSPPSIHSLVPHSMNWCWICGANCGQRS
jgi:sulfonate transport system ATP-binding protein